MQAGEQSIGAVLALSTDQYVAYGVALIALIALAVFWFKTRRWRVVTEAAVLDAVESMSEATRNLSDGLDQVAADHLTLHLRRLLDPVAIGITDGAGTLLSWDGDANEHYIDLQEDVLRAIRRGQREIAAHDSMPCEQRGMCAMKYAVIVPLVVEDRADATIILVGRTQKKLAQMADAMAQFVTTHLEAARLKESQRQLQEAEIKALRAQISPHFVYNALNTISSLIRTDPEEARELLHEFADFTRYCFRSEGYFTTLSEELRNIDRYLSIEGARYGERLNVRLKIEPEVLQVVVPFLLIQPLVENAVQHGLSNKPGGGTLTVSAQDHNGTEAMISVEDDGIGMDPKRLDDMRDSTSSAHIGLTGVNRRLRQVFGGEYGLVVETALDAGMKVTMRIPKSSPGVRPDLISLGKPIEQDATQVGQAG